MTPTIIGTKTVAIMPCRRPARFSFDDHPADALLGADEFPRNDADQGERNRGVSEANSPSAGGLRLWPAKRRPDQSTLSSPGEFRDYGLIAYFSM